MKQNTLRHTKTPTMTIREHNLSKVRPESLTSEPKNLLKGMQTILEFAKNSSLSEEYFDSVKVPMGYLCRRLNLTPTQVTLLAIVMELGFQRYVSLSNIANFLDTSNLEILDKSSEITALMTRRFIVEGHNRFDSGYSAPPEVYDAFRHNEAYIYKVPEVRNSDELVERIDRMLSRLDDSEDENDAETYDRDLRDLLNANSNIRLARSLLAVLKKTTDKEFRVLVLMSMFWIRDEDEEIESRRFNVVLKRQLDIRQMANLLTKGRSNLVKKGYVKTVDGGGILSKDVFALTSQFRKTLTPDRTIGQNGEEHVDSRLTHHENIREKRLFYNHEVENEVRRLSRLLQPEQMNGVLSRLKERGLRGGFTCLLYGGPGTGKTETVLQLARHSGRDIFQVEVSQLRSKWYGESERLVKSVFDEYRKLVAESKVAPIMFFNEADAIFNRRMENAERAVDKGENALQNIILQEMETLDGILIATTNLQDNLDDAFERRFLYKLFLDKPTVEVKARIWQSMLPDLSEGDACRLAAEFDFSGGQIENVARKRFIDEVLSGETADLETLRTLCRNEQLEHTAVRHIGFTPRKG